MEAVSNQLNQIQSLFSLQLAQITDLRQAEESDCGAGRTASASSGIGHRWERLRAITGIEAGELHILREDTALPEPENNLQFWVDMAV